MAQVSAKYVGDFFTDNYGSKLDEFAKRYPGITDYSDNKVDPYFVTNIFASYNFSFDPVAKDLKLFIICIRIHIIYIIHGININVYIDININVYVNININIFTLNWKYI